MMRMNSEDNEGKKESKACSVCGDVALGYNFNAVTCESCKAFFRRNAMKDKVLKCPFKESCPITSVTRRFCQKCRLDKCFTVGMKRELIMTEEDKERKRRKKGDHNRLPQQEQTISTSIEKSSCDVAVQTEPLKIPWDLDQMLTYPQSDFEPPGIPLSPEDKDILNEMLSAFKALDAPLDKEFNDLIGEEFKGCGSSSLLDVINLTAVAIRRLIKMCKRVSGFRSLPQSDQLCLLKQGCTQMLLLRSVMNFDPDKNSWKIPHSVEEMSRIKLEVLKEARGNLYEAHKSWLLNFDQRASADFRVICLLTAIALFDPDRSHLACREAITFTQNRYLRILRRYLDSIYRYKESREIYTNLIEKMAELKGLNDEYVRVYLNVDPAHVEPLLIEIFDLKTH